MAIAASYVVGDKDLVAKIRGMKRRARNAKPAFRKFIAVVRVHNAAVFASEGAVAGRRWAPLSPRYAAWKIGRIGPRPVLQFDGKLLRSLTTRLRVDYGARSLRYWSSDPKVVFHQHGTRHMPPRPPVTMTDALAEQLERFVGAHIVGDKL